MVTPKFTTLRIVEIMIRAQLAAAPLGAEDLAKVMVQGVHETEPCLGKRFSVHCRRLHELLTERKGWIFGKGKVLAAVSGSLRIKSLFEAVSYIH